MLVAMLPLAPPSLGRRLVTFALIALVSGLVPFLTAALDQGVGALIAGVYEDPCGDCPDERESSSEPAPCSPSCDDCLCGPGARVAPIVERVARHLPLPAAAELLVSARPGVVGPPQDPAADALLRPPRA